MKILLLTYARCGSTVYCEEYMRYFTNTPQTILEPYNIDFYKESKTYPFLNRCGVDVDAREWEIDFKKTSNKTFLRGIREQEFIFKYMAGSIPDPYPNMDLIISECKKRNIEIHSLHRKNLSDLVVSNMTARGNKIWHVRGNADVIRNVNLQESDVQMVKDIIEFYIRCKKHFDILLKQAYEAGVLTKQSVYEDDILTNKFLINGSKEAKIKKSVSIRHKEQFLEDNAWVKDLINEAMISEGYDLGLTS